VDARGHSFELKTPAPPKRLDLKTSVKSKESTCHRAKLCLNSGI
jgi:hypothetical protein